MEHEERIFDEAVRLRTAAERSAYLDRACGSDSSLREAVEALLAANDTVPDEFLQVPPTGLDALADEIGFDSPSSDCTRVAAPGVERFELEGADVPAGGAYRLFDRLGEGGMGVVYAAEQLSPVRRTVALKVIKPGMDSRAVITRFEAERQALALMDHPNIARVFDGGTTAGGRPFFVMELVSGTPITRYCDERRLDVRDRLRLLLQVCEAVRHAHLKGIIHRDLKPSNILVAAADGRPTVKVIDFGIAKSIVGGLTERTLVTNFPQLVGTPVYMSPEQIGAGTSAGAGSGGR